MELLVTGSKPRTGFNFGILWDAILSGIIIGMVGQVIWGVANSMMLPPPANDIVGNLMYAPWIFVGSLLALLAIFISILYLCDLYKIFRFVIANLGIIDGFMESERLIRREMV